MAKPIFIVLFKRLPWDEKQRDEIIKYFDFLKEDYHVLVIFTEGKQDNTKNVVLSIQDEPYGWEPEFKMFSDKELEPIDLQTLKQLIYTHEKNFNIPEVKS